MKFYEAVKNNEIDLSELTQEDIQNILFWGGKASQNTTYNYGFSKSNIVCTSQRHNMCIQTTLEVYMPNFWGNDIKVYILYISEYLKFL